MNSKFSSSLLPRASTSHKKGRQSSRRSNRLSKTSHSRTRPGTRQKVTFPEIKKRSILNVRTIKNITNAKPIEIIPPEIIFKDIEPNYTYEITVLVRNLTKKPRRIRIGQPKTSNFRCDYDMVEARAAGIPMKEEFWHQGFKWSLFRINKSIDGLRNRHRFYIRYLTDPDAEKIINYILRNPVSYNNFVSVTSNHKNGPKKWHSIQNNKRVNSMKPRRSKEQAAKFKI